MNIHGVEFKVLDNGTFPLTGKRDWRVVVMQGGECVNVLEASSKAQAQRIAKEKNAFYTRNTGAYVVAPKA